MTGPSADTDVSTLSDWRLSADDLARTFTDGDHCVYNHEADRDDRCAGWFASRLGPHRLWETSDA